MRSNGRGESCNRCHCFKQFIITKKDELSDHDDDDERQRESLDA